MNAILSVLRRFKGSKAPRPRFRPVRVPRRLGLESLEERWLLSTVTELPPLPTLNSAPTAITSAYDGSVWFTEQNANKLGRVSSTGVFTEYAVPTANSSPQRLTSSPDGYVWFTEYNGKKIGRISQSGGNITEFALPGYLERPTAINYTGGKVWFASVEAGSTARLGTITSTGVITKLASANTAAVISSLVSGPDGNLWVTRVSTQWGDSVSKVVTTGTGSWTHYKLPVAGSKPQSITVGADNNLWFTESTGNKIGKITTAGVITEYVLPNANSNPQTIVAGPDGNLWFTEKTGNRIGQITTSGVITEYAVPTAASQPFGITVGPDNNLWFTELSGNKLGKVELS